jgi:hypothetical protein
MQFVHASSSYVVITPADLKPIRELLWGSMGLAPGGPSGRLRHKRTVIATVHESGEPGVALIGVASAGISGADLGPATSTLLAVVPNCSRMGGNSEMNVGIQQRKLTVSR